MGRRERPRARRRLRRSGPVDADADRGRRECRHRHIRRAQPALRDPRARDGRDRQRDDAPLPPRLRLDVLLLQRLHARLDPPCGVDGRAVDLRVHARFDRARRGRSDASADRAPCGAARDAGPVRGPPGRCERDGARMALRDRFERRTRARSCSRDRESRRGTPQRSRATRSSAGPTSCATRSKSPTRRT